MKFKTTKKQIEQNYHRIVSVGYCEAQHLLKYHSPIAYSCGVYGWNADYYDIDGVLIATGYRSLPKEKNTQCNYEIVRRYDDRAMNANSKREIDLILTEFIAVVKK